MAGGLVQLSDGGFNTAAKINLGIKPVLLGGEGFTQSTLTLANGVNDDMILAGDGATNFTGGGIERLNLRGNKANQTAGKGVVLNGVNWFRIKDCYIGYFFGNGIEVTGTVGRPSQGTQIKGNTILYNGGDGMNLLRYTQYIRVIDNSIGENRTPATNAGIRTVSYEGLFLGNNIYNTGYFMYLVALAGSNQIIGNVMVGCERDGIWEEGTALENTIAGGNRVESFGESANATYKAIVIQGADDTIVGNWIKAVTVGGNNPAFGIDDWGTRTLILGNHFRGTFTGSYIRLAGTGAIERHNPPWVSDNSGASTGTGAQQTIAHGLNFTPTRQQIALTPGSATAVPYHSAAPDATNIYVTAANAQAWYWATVG